MRARIAGARTVAPVVWKTIWAESPDWAGKFFFSRSIACWESDFGSEKLLLNVDPVAPAAATHTTSSPIQLRTVIRRWRTHHSARRRIRRDVLAGEPEKFLRIRRSRRTRFLRLRPNAAPAGHLLEEPHALALADVPVLLQVLRLRDAPGPPARARRGPRAAGQGCAALGQGAARAHRRAARGPSRGQGAADRVGSRGLHRLRRLGL